MPPEPLPWDRNKERKHERSESNSLGFTPRWRDSPSSGGAGGGGGGHYGSSSSREFSRWAGSNDFRRPPGHGKQGGWHMFPEENGHGYQQYRSGDKILEDENFRPLVSRADAKYGRNSRESRGYREYNKGHSWELTNNSSPSMSGRSHDVNNDQSSVDDTLLYSSSHPPQSDFVKTWDQLSLKGQHDNNKTSGVNGAGTGQRGDGENSLEWKPVKWARSGSLSSRGSGFSHSSSSKSLGGVDSIEGKAELQPKNGTPVQSPSGNAAACFTSAVLSEETTSRKKPRLGWGEGLAKYEKKKVDGPDTAVNKDGTIVSANNAEPIHSQNSNVAEKSPRLMGSSDCASPATPSSVACSSSPGLEEKSYGKAVNADNDVNNLCGSPGVGSQTQSQLEGSSFNLEKLDISSMGNLGSALIELIQSDDPSSVDSSFMRSTTLNKLLVWKGDISKALEMTELEIDLLENELKSLKFEFGSGHPCLAVPSFDAEGGEKPCNGLGVPCNTIPRPSPLDVDTCGKEIEGKIPDCNGALEENPTGNKDDDIDSPGTATSKFVEPICVVKADSSSDIVKHGESRGDLDATQFANIELKCSVPCTNGEETSISDSRDVNILTENTGSLLLTGDVSLRKEGQDNLCRILASNKESAGKASEVFNKLLPTDQYKIDFSRVATVPALENVAFVKEKFNMRKRYLKFKERVITLKFKAFQHLWKEDMRLLSIRKYRAKSQKKCELSLRATHSGYQKHRSSIRSRFSSPAGNLSLVPTTEIINFTSKLLSFSQPRLYRNELKMPALILDEKEKIVSRFISSNGLVDDPWAVEKERAMINPWTSEEREIFMEKLSTFGKDFQKIATFLDHKTTADCVEFYYKNHKSDCFEKIKMGKQSKSSTNYLVPSGKKWNREMNAASLDILGAASVIAADADNAMRSRQMRSGRIFLGSYNDPKISQGHSGILNRSDNADVLGNERETVAADVLAGICGSMSSEAMSSCITTSVDLGEGYRERKCQNVDSGIKQPWRGDVMQNVDEETCSDESCGEMDPAADWTDEEKSLFIQAVSSYGKDFGMISRCVRTRSRDQCKVFFSKARKCLGLDLMHPGHGHLGTPMSDDANGGGSDAEGGYAFETNSVICSDKLCSKTDEDCVMDAKQDESDAVERMTLCSDLNRSHDATSVLDQKDSKAVKTLASDSCQMEHKPGSVDVDSKIMNGIPQLESEQAQKVSTCVVAERNKVNEEGTSITVRMSDSLINPAASNTTTGIKAKDAVEIFGSEIGNKLEVAENLHQVSVKLDSVGKSPVFSLPKENNIATTNSVLRDSAIMKCGTLHGPDGSHSALNLDGGLDMQVKKSVSRDEKMRHLSLNHEVFSNLFRGLPNISSTLAVAQLMRKEATFERLSEDVINPVASNPASAIKAKDAIEISADGIGNELVGKEVVLPENSCSGRSDLIQDSSITRSTNQLPVDMGSCLNSSLIAENSRQASVELDSVASQENNIATSNSVLRDSAILQCGTLQGQDWEEGGDKQAKKSVSRDENFQHLSGLPLLNHEGSSQILRGYPMQIPTKKEMNGDISCRPLSEIQSLPTSERNATCQLVAQDCYLQKCNSLNAPRLVPEHPVLFHHNEQTNEQPRDGSHLSDAEKPCRNGDVKLFGKILSNPSPLQSPNTTPYENDEKGTHHAKPSSLSSVLKVTGHQGTDGNTALLKIDRNNYVGLEHVPMRSYGFWDGNRIQTGFSSLPDSAVLLAKYPAAFNNYHASSSKMEQQALQAAVNCNESNLNGVPPREINGNNGVVDYQMYSNKVQPFTVDMKPKLQPFLVDMKQRQDMFSEMQKRNGYEAISSLQQQGMGIPGVNVVGRGGILVGGPCAGFSDPVAAIKMHFAKADQYGGQNGSIITDEESWRGSSNGDIGR